MILFKLIILIMPMGEEEWNGWKGNALWEWFEWDVDGYGSCTFVVLRSNAFIHHLSFLNQLLIRSNPNNPILFISNPNLSLPPPQQKQPCPLYLSDLVQQNS